MVLLNKVSIHSEFLYDFCLPRLRHTFAVIVVRKKSEKYKKVRTSVIFIDRLKEYKLKSPKLH